jgi:hypothetical protein
LGGAGERVEPAGVMAGGAALLLLRIIVAYPAVAVVNTVIIATPTGLRSSPCCGWSAPPAGRCWP